MRDDRASRAIAAAIRLAAVVCLVLSTSHLLYQFLRLGGRYAHLITR